MEFNTFLRLAGDCPCPLFSGGEGKNKDPISHCSSFKPLNLPAIVSSFALSLSEKKYNILDNNGIGSCLIVTFQPTHIFFRFSG